MSSAETPTAEIQVTMILIDQLDPNPWNPNELTDEQRAELLAEIQRLGRLPKPIVVRPRGDRYEIVDGEHGWRAARECGLTEVPCEVVDVDDFIARLETYKRNQHGTHNRVREGQLFREMLKLRRTSQRKLAGMFGISEATLRNCLDYAKAADLRNEHFQTNGCCPAHYWVEKPDGTRDCYTPGSTTTIDPDHFSCTWGEAEVSGFTIGQLHAYFELPEGLRNQWADAGRSLRDLEPYLSEPNSGGLDSVLEPVLQMGLADLVSDENRKFHESLVYMMSLADWGLRHATITDIRAYLRPVATCGLNVTVFDQLPCEQTGRAFRAVLSAEEWASILGEAKKHADRRYDLEQLITMGVQARLREKGIALEKVYGPVVAEMLGLLETAPAVIREANHLSLEEKTRLRVTFQELSATLPAEVALEAAQCTVDELCRRRTEGSELPLSSLGHEPVEVLNGFVQQILQRKVLAAEDELFSNHDRLLRAVMDQLEKFDTNWDREVGGRPGREVLTEYLRDFPEPGFQLLASLLCSKHPSSTAGPRWFTAMERLTGSRG
jgi:ParB/RepB/Spo0J family partition protein